MTERSRMAARSRGLDVRLYVSFLTAFLVVNWSSPLAWVLPTLIGTPLIARAASRAAGDRAVAA